MQHHGNVNPRTCNASRLYVLADEWDPVFHEGNATLMGACVCTPLPPSVSPSPVCLPHFRQHLILFTLLVNRPGRHTHYMHRRYQLAFTLFCCN